MRAFIAVDIHEDARAGLGRVTDQLRRLGGDVKWVPARNVHITLKFLGETGEDLVPDLLAAMRAAAAGQSPFRVRLGGLGSFPRKGRPRVVWVGIAEGGRELGYLAGWVDSLCCELGFEREKRPFSAHVTVGRVRSPGGIERLVEALGAGSDFSTETFEVTSIRLMKSDLRPSGAVYTCVGEVNLGRAAD